jgi:hypothetical protein
MNRGHPPGPYIQAFIHFRAGQAKSCACKPRNPGDAHANNTRLLRRVAGRLPRVLHRSYLHHLHGLVRRAARPTRAWHRLWHAHRCQAGRDLAPRQSAPVLHLSAVAARPPRAAAVRPDRGPPEPRPADPARHRRHLVPPGKPPPALGRLPPRPDRSGWPAHRLGHCWVVVGILVKLPVAPHRHVCLPVLPACGTHATPTTPSWCWPTR